MDTIAVNYLRRVSQFQWTAVPTSARDARSTSAEHRRRTGAVGCIAQHSVRLDPAHTAEVLLDSSHNTTKKARRRVGLDRRNERHCYI